MLVPIGASSTMEMDTSYNTSSRIAIDDNSVWFSSRVSNSNHLKVNRQKVRKRGVERRKFCICDGNNVIHSVF